MLARYHLVPARDYMSEPVPITLKRATCKKRAGAEKL